MTTVEAEAGLRETIAHFLRIVEKRQLLDASARESFDVIESLLRRNGPWSPSDAVALYQDDRFEGFRTRLANALGHATADLRRWEKTGAPPDRNNQRGWFPLEYQRTPHKGTPCVYLLFREAAVVYIGSSCNVRARLKVHWRSVMGDSITGWEVIRCMTEPAARQLEADLIFHHQPMFNVVGRSRRMRVR